MNPAKYHFTGLLIFLIPFISSAQIQNDWGWSIGGTGYEVINETIIDQNGNCLVTGEFEGSFDFDPGEGEAILTSVGNADIFIAKYNSGGDFVWAICMGGISNDYSNDIGLDASGNIYITGKFSETADFDPGSGTANYRAVSSFDLYVAKYDPSGNFIWVSTMGGPGHNESESLKIDNAGNVLICGDFRGTVDFDPGAGEFNISTIGSFSNYDSDVFLAKYSALGALMWAKAIGGSNYEMCYTLALDVAGNIYLGGEFNGWTDLDPGPATVNFQQVSDIEIMLLKYDFSGNYIWARAITGPGNLQCSSLETTPEGAIIISGKMRGTIDFDPGNGSAELTTPEDDDHIFLAKYDVSGNYLWANKFISDGTDDSGGNDLDVDKDKNIYLTGFFSGITDFDAGNGEAILNTTDRRDAFIAKYTESGEYVWAVSMESTKSAYGNSMILLDDYSFITAGRFEQKIDVDPLDSKKELTSSGSTDIYLGKFSPYVISWLNDAEKIILNGYPNPTSSVLSVSMGHDPKSGTVEVFDRDGRCVYNKSFLYRTEILLEIEGNEGLYLVKLKTDDGLVQVLKVLKK